MEIPAQSFMLQRVSGRMRDAERRRRRKGALSVPEIVFKLWKEDLKAFRKGPTSLLLYDGLFKRSFKFLSSSKTFGFTSH